MKKRCDNVRDKKTVAAQYKKGDKPRKNRKTTIYDLANLLLDKQLCEDIKRKYGFKEDFDLHAELRELVCVITNRYESVRQTPSTAEVTRDILQLGDSFSKILKHSLKISQILETVGGLTRTHFYRFPEAIKALRRMEEGLSLNISDLNVLIFACEKATPEENMRITTTAALINRGDKILSELVRIFETGITNGKVNCYWDNHKNCYSGDFYNFAVELNRHFIRVNPILDLGADETIGDAIKVFLRNRKNNQLITMP